jgi:photosystem II stability/assembly factor-like uncharacterized protein
MTGNRFLHFTLTLLALIAAYLPTAAQQWDTTSLRRSLSYRLALDTHGGVYSIGDTVLYKSTDEGATWVAVGIFKRTATSLNVDPTGTIYIGNDAHGVFRSTTNGAHWTNSLVTEGCNALAAHPQGYLFAGLTYTGNGKVHRSTDRGDTWTGVQLPNSSNSFAAECFGFSNNNEVYAGTIDGFYRSSDFGISWTQLNSGLSGRNVRTMTVAPNQSIFIYNTYSSSIDGLYRSFDRGQSWQRVSQNAPYFNALTASSQGYLYGVSNEGVFTSTNEGVAWANITGNIGTSQGLSSIVITPGGRIIVGGYRVFRSSNVLTGVSNQSKAPTQFSLKQNYPNPFNPTTTIRFTVPHSGFVNLRLFDLQGKEARTLVNGVKESGEYSLVLDGSTLGSGVYFYTLRSGKFTETRKLLLLR